MGALTYVILIIILLILLIAAGFVTDAANKITKVPGYGGDQYLKSAHSLLTWISVITWGLIALSIIIFIAAIISSVMVGSKYSKSTTSYSKYTDTAKDLYDASVKYAKENTIVEKILIGIIFVIAVLALANGVMAAIAASKIANSPNFPSAKGVYNNCVTAAILGIGATIVALAGAITLIVMKSQYKKRFMREIEQAASVTHKDPERLARIAQINPDRVAKSLP